MARVSRLIISVGVDCTVALFARNRGIRQDAGPFDWAISSLAYDSCFEESFEGVLVQPLQDGTPRCIAQSSGIFFCHESATTAADTFRRRMGRLWDHLRESGHGGPEVHLVRKDHTNQNHLMSEFDCLDELAAANRVACAISRRVPGAQFYYHLLLACDSCSVRAREQAAPTRTGAWGSPKAPCAHDHWLFHNQRC